MSRRLSPTARETSLPASSRRSPAAWSPRRPRGLPGGLRDGRTGLIAPEEILAEIEPLLPRHETAFDEASPPIQALTPRAAKGLEFDRVVLVEPGVIAGGGIEGLRALYVALTRTTKTLVVVHAQPLPRELGEQPGGPDPTGV